MEKEKAPVRCILLLGALTILSVACGESGRPSSSEREAAAGEDSVVPADRGREVDASTEVPPGGGLDATPDTTMDGAPADRHSDLSSGPDASGSDAPDARMDAAADAAPSVPDGCSGDSAPVTSTIGCLSSSAPKRYSAPFVCQPELHFLTTYQASNDHSKEYPATVNFNAARRGGTLVLASYERIAWTVNQAVAGSLRKIVVLGWKASTVTAPPGVTVENLSPMAGYPNWTCDFSGLPTDRCVTYVENREKLRLTSSHYCYHATGFTLN